MKVVRVKVKTIMLAVVIIFFTIPYLCYFIGKTSFVTMSTRRGREVSPYVAGTLKIYENYPTIKIDKGNLYYMLGMSNYDYMREILYFYHDGMTANSSINRNMEQAEIARGYFEKGVELGESDGQYIKNLNALINLEMSLGNNDRAYDLIVGAKSSEDKAVRVMSLINESVYYGKTGEYDKALELCDDNVDELPILESYKNSINYLKCDFEAIPIEPTTIIYDDEYNKKTQEMIEKNRGIANLDILRDVDFIKDMKRYGNEPTLDGVEFAEVSGKVTVEGKPIANAKVHLNSEWYGLSINENGLIDFSRRSEYADAQIVYTNEKGEFSFKYIFPNKNYNIIVGIPSAYADNVSRRENSSVICLKDGEKANVDIAFNESLNVKEIKVDKQEDELVIAYDKVDGAKNYGLMINIGAYGVNVVNIQSGNSDTIKIPLTNGSLQSFGILGYDEDENGNLVISAESILGAIDTKEVWISVIAYDENNKVISRSIDPIKVNIKKKALNKGERLIKDGKIAEGYNWLLNELEKESDNKEYMYPLMRIAYDRKDNEFANELIGRLEEINKTGFDEAMKSYYKCLE